MAVLVLMGVSGSGKTTVGRILARRLDWEFAEADDFHPQSNIDKMAKGNPLTDEDRWPWLDAISAWINQRLAQSRSAVVTCSALKRRYRDVLRAPGVVFVHLTGDPRLLESRISGRHGHFMPAELLASQLADLEVPTADEHALTVDVTPGPSQIVDDIVAKLAG